MERQPVLREEPFGIEEGQEEVHAGDLPGLDLEHLQGPRLVAARRIGPVLAERRTPVGAGGQQSGPAAVTRPTSGSL